MSCEEQQSESDNADEQVAYAQHMLSEAREELVRADGKAGMLLAAVMVAASVLGGAAFAGDWSPFDVQNPQRWLLWGGLSLWLVAVFELGWAAFPRIGKPKEKDQLTYFRHVQMHKSLGELRRTLATAGNDPLQRTTHQLWHVSRVVVSKYRHIRTALVLLFLGVLLLLAAATLHLSR